MVTSLAGKLVHYLHPHYVINIILAAAYFLLKITPPVCTTLFNNCELEMREWELLTFLGCVIVMKTRKTPSYSMYLHTACMFAKMLSVVLFLQQSSIYCVVYTLACLLHQVFMPEPVYKGPEYVTYFRGPHLEQEIERDKRITWLIEFYTPWAPTCVSFSSVFSELSANYSLDNLKFGKIDVGRFPEISKRFQIDTSSWSKQLPTVILFEGGKETRRRPAIDTKGKVRAKFVFCKETMERDFELATLHHELKQNPLNKGKKKEQDSNSASGNKTSATTTSTKATAATKSKAAEVKTTEAKVAEADENRKGEKDSCSDSDTADTNAPAAGSINTEEKKNQ